MSKRGDIEFLSDIKEAIRRIEFYIENINYERFLKDIKTQDVVWGIVTQELPEIILQVEEILNLFSVIQDFAVWKKI